MSQAIPFRITSFEQQIKLLELYKANPQEIEILEAKIARLKALRFNVDNFIRGLSREQQTLIDLLFFKQKHGSDVGQEMNLSRSSLYYKRKVILSQLVDYFKDLSSSII
ncbi:MAG: hypothetical protein ABFC94_05495 [Syntrophomonas sp.]